MYQEEKAVALDTGKWVAGVVLALVVFGSVTAWTLTMLSRPAQVAERVTEPDRMIQAHEWFKQTYEDIQALPAQIATAEAALATFQKDAGPRSGWTYDDRQQAAQLQQSVTALRLHRQQLVAQYNATAKTLTRGFLAWGMPKEVQ
jgi:biopolymer transport protein ExbB/TolQ